MNSKAKINIMHTVLSLEIGGLEKIVYEIVMGMDREVYNVEVCCFDELGAFAKKLIEQNISVTLLRRNQKRYDVFYPIKLRNLLRIKKTDIIHAHSGTFFHATQAGILARISAIIYTDHGRHLVEPKMLLYMDRFCGFFAKKIVAVSKELENYLINIVRLPAKKMTTIINGINTNEYRAKEKSFRLLKELGITQKNRVVGTVGRLVEVKDQMTMIRAIVELAKIIPDVVLVVVGDGTMMTKLKEYSVEQRIMQHIRFVGNREDVPEILNIMEVFLLTSLSEGTSVSLLEAMACGVPAIVTNIGGNPSIVNDGENGFLVEPKNVSDIAKKLLILLESDDVRNKMGIKASETVRQYYALDKMIEKYDDIYKHAVFKTTFSKGYL